VVTGKQDVGARQGKAQMVRRMPGGEEGLERPALALQPIAMFHGKVGHEIYFHILASRGAGAFGAAVACLVAIAHGFRGGGGNERRQAIDVIVMGVGDEDVGETPSLECPQDCCQMRRIVRTWVDQRDGIDADQIGVGALEGEVVGVVGDDPHHSRRELARLAISKGHGRLEGQGFGHQGPNVRRKSAIWRRPGASRQWRGAQAIIAWAIIAWPRIVWATIARATMA